MIDGVDEISLVNIIAPLRLSGLNVVTAGVVSTVVEGAEGIKILADKRLNEINENDYDVLLIPSGPGYKHFINSSATINLISKFNASKKFICAIGESVKVLSVAGVIGERRATIKPGMEKDIPRPRDAKVVVDKNLITVDGPSSSLIAAFKIIEIIFGKRKAEQVKHELVYYE